MTEQPERAGRWGTARPGRREVLRGAAVVGAFLAADLGALSYANAWIGPARLTQQVFLDGFAKVFGRQPGFRKNHAKGVSVAGWFIALALSPAAPVRALGVVEAPMAAFAGRRLFAERLHILQILAGMAVLAGVLLTTLA